MDIEKFNKAMLGARYYAQKMAEHAAVAYWSKNQDDKLFHREMCDSCFRDMANELGYKVGIAVENKEG